MKIRIVAVVFAGLIIRLTSGNQLPETEGRTLHLYLLAQYKTAEGSLEEASKYFDQLLSYTPISTAVYKGYTQFLVLNNQYQKIVELKKKLDESFSDDPTVQLAIVEALDHTHDHKEAIDRLINLSHKNPSNQEIAFKTAQVYLAQHEPENAIRVIDSFLDNAIQKPNIFIFYFFKAQILIQLNKKTAALEAIKKCLKTHSHFDKGWLLCAMLEEQAGNLEGAIKGFSTFLDLVGQDNAVQKHLMQLIFKQKMLAEKTSTLQVSAPCLQKAILLFNQKKPKAALEQLEECLKKIPKDTDARLLKIQVLGSLNQQETALVCLTDWIHEDPSNELWFKTLLLMTNHGIMYSDAIHTLHLIEKKHPANLLPIQYLADLYLRSDQTPQAMAYLKKVTIMSKDPILATKAYYQMGLIYFEQQHYTAMKSVLEKGLSLKPDFAPLCNLLAYQYAKDHELVKAQELISISLHSDPKNPHYLDTQAYIYYKAQDFKKAASIIEHISLQLANDQYVTQHKAKIHAKLAQNKK